MKLKPKLAKNVPWFLAPLVTSSVFVASPSLAVTLASSGGELILYNINQIPQDIAAITNTNTSATADMGSTTAQAEAEASFIVASTSASLGSDSITFGEGSIYEGTADSTSEVLGTFFIEANQSLTLDFTAFLDLETSVDALASETASAIGDLTFLLIDSTTQVIYDTFSLMSNLTSQGDDDSLTYEASDGITITSDSTETNFGGTQESASASIEGSLDRLFTSPTTVDLVAVTTNQASVTGAQSVPESSSRLALLGCFSLMAIGLGVKRKQGLRSNSKFSMNDER